MICYREIVVFASLLLSGLAALAQPGTGRISNDSFDKLLLLPDEEPELPTRHFRLGALVGLNFKAQFAMNGTFKFSQNNPGAAGVGGVDRIYDDGYVKIDARTNLNGMTWNWGYQRTNQVIGDRVYFNAADTYTASGSSEVNSDAQLGFELAYGGQMTRWGNALVGWEFGLGYLPINIEDRRTLSGISATRITHSFGFGGITLPDAPYTGTFVGPGPMIDDLAQAATGETRSDLDLTGSRTLDVTLYSFRLGPTLEWELHPLLAASVSAGAAFGIVSGDLSFDESVTIDGATAVNRGSSSSTELTYGGYLSATLMYHAVEHGDFFLGVQYMPLSNATFNGAGRSAKLDLSGALYISAGVNWPF